MRASFRVRTPPPMLDKRSLFENLVPSGVNRVILPNRKGAKRKLIKFHGLKKTDSARKVILVSPGISPLSNSGSPYWFLRNKGWLSDLLICLLIPAFIK